MASSRWDRISASTDTRPRVAVLDTLAAPRDPELRERLGAAGDDAVRRALRARAVAWARAMGDGAEPLEAIDMMALRASLDGDRGPLVLVAPDVPGLGEHHLAAVRDDLAAGVLLSSAATGDGTPFLVALGSAESDLMSLVGAPFPDLVTAAAARGGELGMIRAERRLTTVSDARALLADPLTAPELRTLLAPLG